MPGDSEGGEPMTDFIDWLTAEMARLNIWNNELARRMGFLAPM
jgi:hypothetical protein